MKPWPSTIAAIIFDMDGVIVDSEPRHVQAFEEVFGEIGFAETHGIRFEDYIGKSDRAVWDDFIARHRPSHSLEHLTEWKQSRLIEILREHEPIFDGLPELVSAAAERYPLAVASGSLHAVIDAVLDLKNLRSRFQVVVSVEDVGRSKPAPDVFLRAAELLGVPPEQCFVIEDSKAGIQAAHAAGMPVAAITNSFPRDDLKDADWIVDAYQEIQALITQKSAMGSVNDY